MNRKERNKIRLILYLIITIIDFSATMLIGAIMNKGCDPITIMFCSFIVAVLFTEAIY